MSLLYEGSRSSCNLPTELLQCSVHHCSYQTEKCIMSQLDSKVEVFILLSEEQVRKPIIFNENEYVLFSCLLISLPFLPLLHKPLSESLGTYRIRKSYKRHGTPHSSTGNAIFYVQVQRRTNTSIKKLEIVVFHYAYLFGW